MEESLICTVLRNTDAISSYIFDSQDWVDAIHQHGFKLLFYGIDLVNLLKRLENHPSSQVTETEYIALELLWVGSETAPVLDPKHFPHGYPELPLLLNSLKPWKWSKDGRHALHLTSCNIELNIGIYAIQMSIPGSPRLAGAHRIRIGQGSLETVESAICCETSDPKVSIRCIPDDRDGKLFFSGHIGKMFLARVFMFQDDRCLCNLEGKLRRIQLSNDTTTQDFEAISAYPQFNKNVRCANESKGLSRLKGPHEPPKEAQSETPDASDGGRHKAIWKKVIRCDDDYQLLLRKTALSTTLDEQYSGTEEREKNFLIAGLGVHTLYNKVPRRLHPVIMTWTSNISMEMARGGERGVTKLYEPPVILHWQLPTAGNFVCVDALDDYIQRKDGKLVIPFLYLRDYEYRLRRAIVTYEHDKRLHIFPAHHQYSFTAGGMSVTLVEAGEEAIAWHLRTGADRNVEKPVSDGE